MWAITVFSVLLCFGIPGRLCGLVPGQTASPASFPSTLQCSALQCSALKYTLIVPLCVYPVNLRLPQGHYCSINADVLLCVRRSNSVAWPRMMVHRHHRNGALLPRRWCMAAGGVVLHGAGVGPAARVSILRGQGVVLARRTHSNKIFLLDRHSNY